jgi:methyl-accepting chemotaxis protein
MAHFNIRTKLTGLLVVFGLLPLGAVMPIVFNKMHDMQQGTLDSLKSTTAQVAETIDRNLFERYGDVQAFGTNAASKDVENWYKRKTETPLIASMNAYMTNYGLYKIMLLVDMEGKVAAVNSIDAKGKPLDTKELYSHSFKDAAWFQKTINKEFLKSDALDGTVVEQPRYEPIVAQSYKGEDGFTITFATPVYDYDGKMIGVWANFADFGLVEGIIHSIHEQKKAAGLEQAAFAVGTDKGIALVDYAPSEGRSVRDSSVIGKKTLESLAIPAAVASLKKDEGTDIQVDTLSGDEDAVGWTKSVGALGFTGLGWTVIMHEPAAEAFASIVNAKNLLYTVIAGALGVIILVGAFIGTLASRPLRKISAEITRLASGDFSQTLEGLNSKDEIGEMAHELNGFILKMREMIGTIIESAAAVNSAATEIATGSTDLSQRTEEQASSLEETAASMEEITGTVKQNSANAGMANDLSAKASTVANDGGRVVEEAVSAMGNIERSSQKISDIIGVIDEIAFQTNLLALNAAVEAARAGDAGKGFAVVASEVRSLAGRSASASKEIKALINESAGQVKTGAELVNQAGRTLRDIVSSVQQVAGIVSEIASASHEQSTGIDEINSAITQMDEVTQQNAALVEENTAAATSMVEQARELERMMSFFTLSDDEGAEIATNVVALEPVRQAVKAKKPTAPKAAPKPTASYANGAHKAKPVARTASPKALKTANGSYDSDWKEF